ncbi:MAG TPA: TraR/DksA C4-type zinc finger protein [Kiritimatiellia bacterium]|nr:TraR/DksA C4-type zinc finger protein [Kiritimatiellia bacterium]
MATKKSKPVAKKSSPRKASRLAAKPAKKAPAKQASKKTPVKKAAAKKAPAKKAVKKPAPRKATVRKTVKKAAKKAAPARKPAKKPAAKKAVRKAAAKPAVRPAAARKKSAPAPAKARAFRKEELAQFRAMLQKQLELVQGNLNALAGDNLKRSPLDSTGDISSHSTHMADHGTDNFDRELALSLASSRQDSIYEIEDAIRRIDEGEYGTCQSCGKPVERPRLKALPFAKKCVACQSAAERGRSRFQPFTGAGNLQTLVTDDTVDLTDS